MYDRFDGGRLIGQTLATSGVETIFCLHGGHIDPILYGCAKEGIRVIDTRHEQAAAHMAEGWSLATGQTGVCAVTAGPGITDAVTGLANANMAASPMLCLSGSSPLSGDDTWTLQDMAQLPMVKPITKWARVCTTAERAGQYASMALAESRNGRPGPAYLEVPLDVLMKPVDGSKVPSYSYEPPSPPAANPDAIAEVAKLIGGAERPVIIAGSGSHWAGAGSDLSHLAKTVGIPVFTTNAGRGEIPDQDEWCFGPTFPLGSAFGMALSADLVICLGTRLGFTLMDGKMFASKTLIRVDVDAGEIRRNTPGEINIVADAAVFCRQLANGWEGGVSPARQAWRDQLQSAGEAARAAFFTQATDTGSPIHPLSIVRAINELSGPEATLVADGGDSMVWAMAGYEARGPGHVLGTNAYFGCLGVGIPYAIAAKAARPNHPVFLMQGDGSFGLNAMEFDTALRHDLPFVCVIANDSAWGMSKHGQGLQFGYEDLIATELGARPYHDMIAGLGGYGELVTEAEEIKPAIERALASGKASCVNVTVDPTVYSPATSAMLGL